MRNGHFCLSAFFKVNFSVTLTILLVSLLCFSLTVKAQQPDELPETKEAGEEKIPDGVAPPPLKLISETEKNSLESETSVKKRTQVAFQMMDARLAEAEKFFATDDFKQSLANLAAFHALMDNAYGFLAKNDINNKADNRFRAFEIYLRKQMPRLEVLRRTMPFGYSYHVLKLMKAVRETRAKAVEPLFEGVVAANP